MNAKISENGFFYCGCSMKGVFQPGDFLHVTPVTLTALRLGDIIVFRDPAENKRLKRIAHRIVAIDKNRKISTRGDNNLASDTIDITKDILIGRVDRFERNGKLHCVAYGYRGLFRAYHMRLRLVAYRKLIRLFRLCYAALRNSRFLTLIWNPKLQEISFDTPTGKRIKYLHCGKTVMIKEGRKIILKKRPYDLLVDN